MGRGAWRATVYGVAKSGTQLKQVSTTWRGLEAACLVMNHYNPTESLLIRLNETCREQRRKPGPQ